MNTIMKAGKKKPVIRFCIGLFFILAAAAFCALFFRLRGSISVKPLQSAGFSESVYYLQKDPLWAGDRLGDSEFTMASSGCLTSCLTGVIKLEGIIIPELEAVNPGSLNRFFAAHHVYDGAGNIQWKQLEAAIGRTVVTKSASEVTAGGLEMLLSQNICPIVRVRVKGLGSFHYVLITKSDGRQFWCMDPLNSEKQPVPLSQFGSRIYAVRYILPEGRDGDI